MNDEDIRELEVEVSCARLKAFDAYQVFYEYIRNHTELEGDSLFSVFGWESNMKGTGWESNMKGTVLPELRYMKDLLAALNEAQHKLAVAIDKMK